MSEPTDITDSQFETDGVDDLGNGANFNGAATKGGNKFADGDDMDTTMFVLRSKTDEDLWIGAAS